MDTILDRLLMLPEARSAQLSPDGNWVAWNWAKATAITQVFVCNTAPGSKPIQLTDFEDESFLVEWSPGSDGLIIGHDWNGNERVQLFLVRQDKPLEPKPLTEPNPPYYLYGGSLHRNGNWLVYSANYDFEHSREVPGNWIYRHDLTSTERVALAKPMNPASQSPSLNSLGTHIVYTRKDLDAAGEQIWLVDIHGRQDREIFNCGSDRKAFGSWFPDGERLLILAEAQQYRYVGIYSIKSGLFEKILDDPSRNIEAVMAPYNSESIIVCEVLNGSVVSSLLDIKSREETPFPKALGNVIPLGPIPTGQWAAECYSSQLPRSVLTFPRDDRSNPEAVILSKFEQHSDEALLLSPAIPYKWKGSDGMDLHGWLYKTPKKETVGTVVIVHGGPTMHSENRFSPLIQYLSHTGFNVFEPNYRGSTGFGLVFQDAIKQNGWGGMEQEDIRFGIEALIQQGIASEHKVGITGTSYGGYSAWCAITRYPRRLVAAAAPICGMTDLKIDYDTTRPDLKKYSEEMMGGSPNEVPELYFNRSPINFVDRIEGEVLIVQGLQDPNVTPENMNAVVAQLRKFGKVFSVLTFEDEGHGIAKSKNQRILIKKLAEFFQQSFESLSQEPNRGSRQA